MIPFGPAFWRKEIADLEVELTDCRRIRRNAPWFATGRKLADQLTVIDGMIAKYEEWIAEYRALLAAHGEAA